ncbi:hypothetical protein HPG69_010388 [Diceros bicornis minor]|uniref:Uncharacterized protein n=1 Tax=Diceros bicornis minor TaxID=77932 RepID=A0A7J7F7M9_DICBM|nr:hypothetical protein HPG69_010388 [Diceros bicornis minor]
MPDGNFQHGYHLLVLVSPEATLLLRKNKTAVCKEVAGKPAAEIFWAPEGDCIAEHEPQVNSTATVQSTSHDIGNNVFYMTCPVFRCSGDKSLT